jgi:hypothetical protein|tara:strand:- start:1117 stop:1521 length:405 start_codon:yes stop_codon:yes gene_type:complete
MLVSKIVEKVEIPHEDGEWVELRQLSWTAMEEAIDAKQERDVGQVKRMGGDVFEAIMRSAKKKDDDEEEKTKGRTGYESYDQETLIRKSVVSWSYDGKPTVERIRDLDSKTAKWLSLEIYERNKPPTEDEEKNG